MIQRMLYCWLNEDFYVFYGSLVAFSKQKERIIEKSLLLGFNQVNNK